MITVSYSRWSRDADLCPVMRTWDPWRAGISRSTKGTGMIAINLARVSVIILYPIRLLEPRIKDIRALY